MTVTPQHRQDERLLRKWMLEFLERDGLGVLLESLERLGARGFSSVADTFSQLQCVGCLRAVMNSRVGLEYIVHHREYTRQLANILMSRNNSVKLQVFELLCALCMYSRQGYNLALDSLNYFKMSHGRRYRFDLVVDELRTADTEAYKTTLLAFVNCMILGAQDLGQRSRIRTELFGVGLESVLTELRSVEDSGLQIQLKAFDDSQAHDEELEEPLSICHLFDIIYRKVASSPQVLGLQALLLALSQLDPSDQSTDRVWDSLQEVVSEAQKARKPLKKPNLLSTRNFSTQTTGRSWLQMKKTQSRNIAVQVDVCPTPALRTMSSDTAALSRLPSLDDSVRLRLKNNTAICKNCKRTIVTKGGDQETKSLSKPLLLEDSKMNETHVHNLPDVSPTKNQNQRRSFTKIRKSSVPPPTSQIHNSVSIEQPFIKNILATQSSALTASSTNSEPLISGTSVPPPMSNLSQSPSPSPPPPLMPYNIIPILPLSSNHLSPSTPQHKTSIHTPMPSNGVPPPPPMPTNGVPPPPPMPFNNIPQPPLMPSNGVPPPPPMPTNGVPPPPPMPFNSVPPPPPMLYNRVPPPPPMPTNGVPPPPPMPFNSVPPPPPMPSNGVPLPPPMHSIGVPLPPPMPFNGFPPPPPMPSNGVPPPPPLQNGQVPVLEDFIVNERVSESMFAPSAYKTSSNYHTLPNRKLSADINLQKYNTLPKPSKKMKTLNWTKVPNQIIGKSVWASVTTPSMAINYNEIDELFCQKSRPKTLQSQESTVSQAPPLTCLLDSKRSLAVNIFLKQFRTGSTGVLQAIRECSGMTTEKLKGFLRILPDEQETVLVKAHPGELNTLDTAERFFAQLITVPDYTLRAQAMLQKEECPAMVAELSPKLQALTDICDSLTKDVHLAEFLALLLQLGNYLNAGSYAGNAAGFKLNTLPKLLDTRANKPRMTFLHFTVDVARTHSQDLLSFTGEMARLKDAARNPLTSLEEEVKNLALEMRKLEKQVKAAKSKDILPKFKEFLKDGLRDVADLEGLVKAAKKAEVRLAEHFCEDPAKFQPEECFLLLANFYAKVNQAIVDNEQRRKQEEKAANMEAAKSVGVTSSSSTNKKTGKTKIFKENKTDLVDILMSEIKTGNFKLRRSLPSGSE